MIQRPKVNIPKPPNFKNFTITPKQRVLLGAFIFLIGLTVFISLASFLLTWESDQSTFGSWERKTTRGNLLKALGVFIGQHLMYRGFGLMSFSIAILLGLTGLCYFLGVSRKGLVTKWFWGLYMALVGSMVFGFQNAFGGVLSGVVGYEMNHFLQDFFGEIGTGFILLFLTLIYLVVRFDFSPDKFSTYKENINLFLDHGFSAFKSKEVPEPVSPVVSPQPTDEEYYAMNAIDSSQEQQEPYSASDDLALHDPDNLETHFDAVDQDAVSLLEPPLEEEHIYNEETQHNDVLAVVPTSDDLLIDDATDQEYFESIEQEGQQLLDVDEFNDELNGEQELGVGMFEAENYDTEGYPEELGETQELTEGFNDQEQLEQGSAQDYPLEDGLVLHEEAYLEAEEEDIDEYEEEEEEAYFDEEDLDQKDLSVALEEQVSLEDTNLPLELPLEVLPDEDTGVSKSKKKSPKSVSEIELETTAPIIEVPVSSSSLEDPTLSAIVSDTYEDPSEALSKQLVDDFGEFDPRLELSNYQFPVLDLLKDYSSAQSGITIDQNELEENKNTIVETLRNYKIEIDHIKATIGPTVTLYEIIPQAGIRISKIKNLEDDIALSLAALGIRIIAPIPGKGTIGIEVPNKKSTIVSMRSSIAAAKFQDAEMELPISFGKTISNETFVVDLAKMPHLLMAGATGQGKSVGLNAILTSLLYKKHPAEVKFVLVDPKKVELTLFNKIERHFLAKLPDADEAIITDNTKVIHTLNSLCIEMDARYELLKDAYVRNVKEYNVKFKQRKLNPENGHRFLPYIVLVVDEFADLIMTAGKEVEIPIARLAQLARAVGIHLIIATQRPSVNVITGMIKANFPARLAFRVMSKIDSRTILDASGADQLVGRGDMLFTNGNNLVRVQCAFVDTPEVERITNYIGAQRGYADAHLLPEYETEDNGTAIDIDVSDRDKLFYQAAEIVVSTQQGSTSLLQRKLKLGYNRAGRIIDQLEAAGIVGAFEGSKARQVLIPDLNALDQFLNQE